MKKITALILSIIFILTLASCAGNTRPGDTGSTTTASGNNSGKNDGVSVQFNGDTIKLNYERDFFDIRYLENIGGEMRSDTVYNLRDITYTQNGDVTLVITMYRFENKTMEEVMEGTTDFVDKTVNGITYKYMEDEIEFEDGKKPGHSYAYFFNGSTYVVRFASSYDFSALEEAFMNNVRFEKSEA
jgi:hypothetical protein